MIQQKEIIESSRIVYRNIKPALRKYPIKAVYAITKTRDFV